MTNRTDSHFTHRAFEARKSALEATNPIVRAIYRDLDRLFKRLAVLPNAVAIGPADWPSHPTDEILGWRPDGAAGRRTTADRSGRASTRDRDRWENEGGRCA